MSSILVLPKNPAMLCWIEGFRYNWVFRSLKKATFKSYFMMFRVIFTKYELLIYRAECPSFEFLQHYNNWVFPTIKPKQSNRLLIHNVSWYDFTLLRILSTDDWTKFAELRVFFTTQCWVTLLQLEMNIGYPTKSIHDCLHLTKLSMLSSYDVLSLPSYEVTLPTSKATNKWTAIHSVSMWFCIKAD